LVYIAGVIHSNPILASSPMPQFVCCGRGGLSSSLPPVKLLVLLFKEFLFKLSGLKPELLALCVLFTLFVLSKLLTLSAYSGGASEVVETAGMASGLEFSVGVGEGVISVLGDISTSSASLYHLLLLVYFPQPSWPRRPSFHYFLLAREDIFGNDCGNTPYLIIIIYPTLSTTST
jgi:hypothetical protein